MVPQIPVLCFDWLQIYTVAHKVKLISIMGRKEAGLSFSKLYQPIADILKLKMLQLPSLYVPPRLKNIYMLCIILRFECNSYISSSVFFIYTEQRQILYCLLDNF